MTIENERARLQREVYYKSGLESEIKAQIQKKGGRKWEYLTENKGKVILVMGLTTGTGALTGAATGLGFGALLGCPGGPPGMLGGALIGLGVGAAIGALMGTAYLCYDYHQWLETDEGKRVGGSVFSYLEKDPVLENFVCSLSTIPVINPVMSPAGHIYEKLVIEEWLKKKEIDPLTGEKLTVEDLKPCPDISIKMAKRLTQILEEDTTSIKDLDEGVKNGMNKLKADIETKRDADFNDEMKTLQAEKKSRKLTIDEYSKKVGELMKKYY